MTPQELKSSILQLAIQGKLVKQRPEEGTGEELYRQIQAEKKRLIQEGKIKKEKPLPEIAEDEVPFEIPDGWKWAYLGELFLHNTGKAQNSSGSNKGVVRKFITTSNLYWNRFDLSKVKEMPFTEQELERCTAQKGDLLVCEGGDCGRAAIWNYDEKVCIQNHVHRIRPYKEVSIEYFYYLFYLYKFTGRLKGHGVAIQGLSSEAIHKVLCPLPPLAEQKRIVAKIEELLLYLDRYEKAWNRLEEFNRRFPADMQKSILQMAIQGKLVEQRPEEGTGEELYRQIQAEKQALIKAGKIKKEKPLPEIAEDEVPFEIPEGWKWCRLLDLCSLIGDIDHNMPKSVDKNHGVLFLSAKDLLDDGSINYIDNVKYISNEDYDRLSRKVKPQLGDIVYSRIGACLGKARTVKSEVKFLVSYSCCIIRSIQIDVDYLRYYLESPIILAHSVKARQSIGVPDLGMGEIKKYFIALPPLAEQKRIVERLEELLPVCERLK